MTDTESDHYLPCAIIKSKSIINSSHIRSIVEDQYRSGGPICDTIWGNFYSARDMAVAV